MNNDITTIFNNSKMKMKKFLIMGLQIVKIRVLYCRLNAKLSTQQ
jgi:hypothetical protein